LLQRYEEAISQYKKAIEIKPVIDENYYYLGNCYYLLQRYEEAIPQYKKAIFRDCNKIEYHNKLGETYFSLKRYEKAIPLFKKAIEMKPTNEMCIIKTSEIPITC